MPLVTMSEPRLTVILPVRNGENFIAAAIASVLKQSYENFDLWILENGSDDRTLDVARSFRDARIRVLQSVPWEFKVHCSTPLSTPQPNGLLGWMRTILMFPNRLQLQVKFIKAHPEVVFVGSAGL